MKQFNVIQNRANQDIRRLRQLLAQNTSLPLQPQVRSSNPPVLSEYKYYTALLKDVTSVPPVDDAQPTTNVPVVPQPPGEAITSPRFDDKQVLSAILLTNETGSVPPTDDGTTAPVTRIFGVFSSKIGTTSSNTTSTKIYIPLRASTTNRPLDECCV